MKHLTITTYLLMVFSSIVWSQNTISGSLTQLPNQSIRLEGFNGLQTYVIASTTTTENGSFSLNYRKEDYGVGYLMSSDNKAFFVILSGEATEIKGEALSMPESLQILKGQQNQWFGQYAREHPRREQALSAWAYLEKIYGMDSLFAVQTTPKQAIAEEKQRIKAEDSTFLAMLPKDSYVSWFLPARKLVSSVSVVAQYRTEELPATIAAFRNLDYADPRLYKSGLFRDAIESHFWLLENSGRSLDSVFVEMKTSIDAMMDFLIADEQKLNEVTDYLFDLLERHSLFQASEYLALKVLNEVGCTIDNNLARQLETYRAMKKGNTAPDFEFAGDVSAPAYEAANLPEKLSDIQSDYILVVFGASWCPKCTQELPEIAKNYAKWKSQQVEVVFVSLDDDKQQHASFAADFPFIAVCDYKKWDSPIVSDYYVFATPTMYLLDKNREILLRPNSINQMDAWVDWFLVQGNK